MLSRKMFAGRWRKALWAMVLVPMIAINAIAWMQAHSMTQFVASGQRTARLEKLSIADKLKVALMGVELPRPLNRRALSDEGLAYETHRIQMGDCKWLETLYFYKCSRNLNMSLLECVTGLNEKEHFGNHCG